MTPSHMFVEPAGTLVPRQGPQRRRLPLGQTERIARARQQKPTSAAPLMQRINEQSIDVADLVRFIIVVFSGAVLTEPNDVVSLDEGKHAASCRLLSTDSLGPVSVVVLRQPFLEHPLG
jgi:hypothetical protein